MGGQLELLQWRLGCLTTVVVGVIVWFCAEQFDAEASFLYNADESH